MPIPRQYQVKHPRCQICTEGRTEAIYIEQLVERLSLSAIVTVNSPNRNSRCVKQGCGKQHTDLLDQMQECGRNWSNVSEQWLVHDLDRVDAKSIQSFDDTYRRSYSESGIHTVYSIPCFEYWLLLHHSRLDSDLTCEGCQDKVKRLLRRNNRGKRQVPVEAYKTDPDMLRFFTDVSGQAVSHAKSLFGGKIGDPPFCPSTVSPSTNFHKLVERLRRLSDDINGESHSLV